MGVESEVAQVPVQAGSDDASLLLESDKAKVNQGKGPNEAITFGSHGVDEQAKGEAKTNVTNFPKDAVDEWPAPKQIHSFYFPKYRSYEDPKLKSKVEQADRDVQKWNQARAKCIEEIRAKRGDRQQVIGQMKSLNEENKQFWSILDEKKKEMEPLQQALGKLREKGGGVFSSEAELNNHIKSLEYRIQHESIPLTEEKLILREIKQLEGTREKVIANAAMRAKIQESLGEKDSIQDQVKSMGVDLDGVRKDHKVVKAKRKQLEDEKDAIDKVIKSLEDNLKDITQKRDEGYKYLQELRKQREEGNASYYKNRSLLIKAKDLAAKKDVESLKGISETEGDKFISEWSSSKAFRDDYERRILQSLDMRQLSRDGRMRNPDEKPLVLVETTARSQIEPVEKTNVKKPKEEPAPAPKQNSAANQKVNKEANGKPQKEAKSKAKATSEPVDLEEKEEIFDKKAETPAKPTPKEKEIDEAKLREMKREEEIAKAKLAMERKKKLAEKAAAKAALKAQKEAEKKLKNLEKKAKKKASASTTAPDSAASDDQADAEVVEPEAEKAEESIETPAPSKSREDRKERAIRQRSSRQRGPESIPKIILKRKKSTNYWLWAAPAAAVLVLLLALAGYNYLL